VTMVFSEELKAAIDRIIFKRRIIKKQSYNSLID
jgi:hypothetical protein